MTWERVPPEMPRVPPPMTTDARLRNAMPVTEDLGGLDGEQRDGVKDDGPGIGLDPKDDRQERDEIDSTGPV
jgi:hypothetical protein